MILREWIRLVIRLNYRGMNMRDIRNRVTNHMGSVDRRNMMDRRSMGDRSMMDRKLRRVIMIHRSIWIWII